MVLVVRNARHSTEAKGTRLTPKEPDRPAAIMPFNACPSSAATGAPRAVKRSRPVDYVAQPDAQRAVPYRQHALLRNDQAEPDEPVPHWARCPQARCPRPRCPQPRCPQPRCPRRSTDRTGADNGLARFPRSHCDHAAPPSIFRDRLGIRLCRRDIVHRRTWRATNSASAGCGPACSEVAIAHLDVAASVARVESCPGLKQGRLSGLDRLAEARSLRRLAVADQGRDESRSPRSTARVEWDDRLRAAPDQSSPALRIALTVGGTTAVSCAVSDTASRVFSPSPVL